MIPGLLRGLGASEGLRGRCIRRPLHACSSPVILARPTDLARAGRDTQ